MGLDWYGKTDADMWPPEAVTIIRARDEAALRGSEPQVFSQLVRLEDGPHTFLLIEFTQATGDPGIGVVGIAVDITGYSNAKIDHAQLATVIEQTAESVMMAGLDGRITYVNPAFERVSGYTREEAIGRNPRLLSSGLQPASFYQAMWAALASGSPWAGDLVNRRKDGTLLTEEVRISPIRDGAGAITSYVAVERDVSRERALEESSSNLGRQRTLIAETIRSLRAGDTPEATAQAICRQVASFSGINAAQLLLFGLDGRATPIGYVVVGEPDPPLRPHSHEHSRQLRGRAAEGPWIEPWKDNLAFPNRNLLNGTNARSLGFAPVRYDDRVIGLLIVQSADTVDKAAVTEALPALVEFANLAGALIGRDVADRTEVGRGRNHVLRIIADRSFGPVFQPIVDLKSHLIVGYEALTRFNDGTNPEIMFDQATAVGLGVELETATLKVALAAAELLPRSAWLDLNASPELVLAGEPLRTLLSGTRRKLVLEVTEHTVIADYSAFRAAMVTLGPKVKLAVDDAGSGFASLRHILELGPAYVKLDRSLIAGLESDEARQAMIIGLRHFARMTGCALIAEGIETKREIAVLRSLGINLGQGYALGRPKAAGASPSLIRPRFTVGA